MNFRKFISGISALTIAATAFASMAVVANAEGEAHVYAKATINGDSVTIKDFSKPVDSEKVTVYYDKYVEYNGVYYEANTTNSDIYYGYQFTEAGSQDVTYTATDYVYASEETQWAFSRKADDATTAQRYSGGSACRIYGHANSSGHYITINGWHSIADNTTTTIYLTGRNRSSRDDESYSIYYKVGLDGELTDTNVDITFNKGNASTQSATVTLPANAYIVIYHGQKWSSNTEFDCVAIKAESPNFSVDLGDGTVATGTEDHDAEQATWYIATITNSGSEGSFSTMTLTKDGNDTATQNLSAGVTLASGADAYIGVIIAGGDYTGSNITAKVE